MSAAPRVSVCMPVFNTIEFLGESLRSISNQCFSDFELVVIDDGSTDGSGPFLETYASTERRMRLIRRGNRGLIATRNELLARARGELVAWMDSDDASLPDRLTKQLAAFDADPSLVCVGTFARCVDSDGARLNLETYSLDHQAIVQEQLRGGGMRFPTTMMKRQAALDAGGFREPLRMGEDLDLLLRLGEIGRLANLPLPLYVYRQHLASVCATLGSRWEAYRAVILELARERREFGQDRLQRGETVDIAQIDALSPQRFVARTCVYWSRCALDNQDRWLALKYASRAVLAQPLDSDNWGALMRAAFTPWPPSPFGATGHPTNFHSTADEPDAGRTGPLCDITVAIVSYNTEALLASCLDRLTVALAGLDAQVVIVDNQSRDGSVKLLRARYSQYEIIENIRNVGFGRANNQVLAHARGRHLLLLNTDAYVEPDAVKRTLAYMDAHSKCGVLGTRLVGADGQVQPSCRFFPTPWNVFLLHTGLHRFFPATQMVDSLDWDPALIRQCDWVPGCFYLVRQEVIDTVGLFDPRFFLYYEEVDHCRAVKNAGWEVTYFPTVTVTHLGGESAKSDASLSAQGRQISTLQAESELLYFRKHHGAIGAWQALLLGGLADLFTITKSLVRRRDRSGVSGAWRRLRLSASVFLATHGGRRATR